MKKGIAAVLLVLLLWGCAGEQESLEPALQLRRQLQDKTCNFDAVITADYGTQTYTFAMGCEFDAHGNLLFAVQGPDTIAGITGMISEGEGKLTFDDTALAFELMAEGTLSPVSAPWMMMKALRSGYIESCGPEGENLRLSLRDSYEADALQVEVWLDGDSRVVQGEIFREGRRILTVEVKNFCIV